MKSVAAACLATAAVAVGIATAGPAQATGSVHISEIYYNSAGSDTRSNTSLNGEWVKVTNSTTRSASLTGWTITDASAHAYKFGTYALGAGKSVYVHTGKGTNTSLNRYQGRAAYVWNNDKDTATLRRSTGSLVDVCSYNNSTRSYAYC
jgi:hypothetical protein